MPIHQLTLESLEKLDFGKAAEAFKLHLRRAAVDCLDRPGDKKPRGVMLEVAFEPVLEPDGDCREVRAQIHVSSKVPKHRTKVYSFGLRKNGMVVFNEDAPDNFNQATMFEEREDTE